MKNVVPTFFAALVLVLTSACDNIVDLDSSATGCRWDTECSMGEFCSAQGDCRAIDDGTKGDEPDVPAPETIVLGPEATPEDTAPDATPESEPSTATPDSEPDATPETSTPETVTPEEEVPECTSDAECSNGLTCIDETCVVGCDGVAAAGSCNPFQLSYCANPGSANEQVRVLAITDPVCFGDILVDSCSADGAPLGIDCVAAGGDCSQGACVSMPAGQMCDDDNMLCGDDDAGQPLACANKDPEGVGVCESGCGDITYDGTCTGTTMRYCADEGLPTERIESYNCIGGDQCGEMRPGIDGCVGASGQGATCWDSNVNDGEVSYCGGEGGQLACELDLDDGRGRCEFNNDSCDDSQSQPTCSGNRLMLYCYQSQPIVLNCQDYGGSCNSGIGACVGVDRYQPCDQDLRCANGLTCWQGRCDL